MSTDRADGAAERAGADGAGGAMAAPEPPEPARLADAAHAAFALAARLDWRSYDPYDLLLSPLGGRVQSTSWLAARVVVQVGKRSGVGLRRALGVHEHVEAKTLSDFLSAAVRLARAGLAWADEPAEKLPARLVSLAVETPNGQGWGLGFPYASRFVNVGRGSANLYTTTGACQALLDHHALTAEPASLAEAVRGVGFILEDLGWFEHGEQRWLRYWPGLETRTVNVQASAAALLARLGRLLADERLAAAADDAARTALALQAPDGSWPYADDPRARFVDGFHTGFTLQGLSEYGAERGERAAAGLAEALHRGLDYFRAHLLTADGRARAFADGTVSHDGQTVAQAAQTLAVCAGDARAAGRIWAGGLERLLRGEPEPGARFPALRWSVGPAVLATAHVLALRGDLT